MEEPTMDQSEKKEDCERWNAPPDVDTTPAALPPCPQPSITGAQTALILESSASPGFLFSIDWLAFTVPCSTPTEAQKQVGGEWIELEKGFNGYPRAWLCISTAGGSGRIGTGMRHRTA